jgi:hypothetical protein
MMQKLMFCKLFISWGNVPEMKFLHRSPNKLWRSNSIFSLWGYHNGPPGYIYVFRPLNAFKCTTLFPVLGVDKHNTVVRERKEK